jgi:hypothetical protein
MSNITPLFFVECLADLEKAIRSRGIQFNEDLTRRIHRAANASTQQIPARTISEAISTASTQSASTNRAQHSQLAS